MSVLNNCTYMTLRSFLILGLSLILGLAIFGFQIGRAVKTGREFDRYLSVKGLSEREVKAIGQYRACFRNATKRRVRARGLQETAGFPVLCRPGPLTGQFLKHALRASTSV